MSSDAKIDRVKQRRACPTVQPALCVCVVVWRSANTASLDYLPMFVFAEAILTPNINTANVLR